MGRLNGALTPPFSHSMTLPRVVDDLALETPDQTWVTIARSSDLTHGWRDVTFKELAVAVNTTAKWIEETIGLAHDREVVAYMGINDIRYAVVMLALLKTGYKPLLPSLRNSEDGQLSLIRSTKCTAFLYSDSIRSQIEPLETADPGLITHQVPSLEATLDPKDPLQLYPNHHGEDEDDHALILHTSGSTGLPKPIYLTNGGLATVGVMKTMPAPEGQRNAHDLFYASGKDHSLMAVVPFFHAMGMISILRSIFCQGPLIILPTGRPLNSELIVESIRQTKPWAGIFPPSLLEDLSELEAGMDALAVLEYAFYGGAPLAREAGNRINTVCNVTVLIGSTEAMLIPKLLPQTKEDWEYFEWSLGSGVDMEPEGEGLYEMVLKRSPDRTYQGIFHTFPHLQEYRTKDLWERHPSKPTLWRYKGRKDDVLVLSNGEKFNPVGFEKAVEDHPAVKGAVVVGQQRFQTGLLIEPDWNQVDEREDPGAFIDRIWATIEQANQESPGHGRVWKSKIALAKKEKPFVRAPKGSIMRRKTVDLYEREIDALYSNEGFNEELGQLPTNADLETTKAFLRKAVGLTVPGFKENASDDTDFFSLRVDSLQVLGLASTLSHAMKGTGTSREASVAPRTIYANPTITALAAAVMKTPDNNGSQANGALPAVSREQKMADMFAKYTQDLPSLPPKPEKRSVILTGSTGALGGYILQTLIGRPNVNRIFCLNRSADAELRQKRSFEEVDVTPDFSKVTFLHTDFGKDRFNLDEKIYQTLLDSVDVFIHNAWAVDFNKALESYEEVHIAGTRRCVDFSLQSRHRAHIFFVSSIAGVGNWGATNTGEVPERFFSDDTVALSQGYGESKHVAEKILAAAAQRVGVPSTILRCGQLAGPAAEKGVWNRHEWVPSIVSTSKAMGIVPNSLGNQDLVDWVPVDVTAQIIVELGVNRLRRQEDDRLDVFHIVNPKVVSWRELVPVIQEYYGGSEKLRSVPFAEWVAELRKVPVTAEEVKTKPGIKLLDFYEGLTGETGLPRLATAHTVQCSKALRELNPVNGDLMRNYLNQWQF